MVTFGDLSTSSCLKALNEHLATRSYIEGYVPCQADVSIFSSLATAPSAEYCHLARWYRHIKSFSTKEQESFPSVPESTQAPAAPPAAKQAVIAKSSLLLDVKPWDDETDMAKMEECVRTIQCDGLLWGKSNLVPLAF